MLWYQDLAAGPLVTLPSSQPCHHSADGSVCVCVCGEAGGDNWHVPTHLTMQCKPSLEKIKGPRCRHKQCVCEWKCFPYDNLLVVSESVNGNDTERDVWVTHPLLPGMMGLVTRPVLSSLAPMCVYIYMQKCEIYRYPNTGAVLSKRNSLKRLVSP